MTHVAVVTGAARGIGAATVIALAAKGWSVVAVDRAADDPRLPYPMGTPAELEGTIASALAVCPHRGTRTPIRNASCPGSRTRPTSVR